MSYKDKLEKYLREQGVPYEVQNHPTAYTSQEVAASEHIPGSLLAKVVMVVADGKLVMLVLPADDRVYMGEVAHVLNAHEVRLAEEEEFAHAFPGCQVGAMAPFGNLFGIPVYVDPLLAADETFFFQAGTYTHTISMKYADYERLVKPTVVPFSLAETLVLSK